MCQRIVECVLLTRDLIRGGHYGQRSCEPHLKAEHMAALTKAAANVKESSCQLGAVHTWHLADNRSTTTFCPLMAQQRPYGQFYENTR